MAAVYPQAAGTPSFSGNVIPVLYSTMMLAEFYDQTCLSEICNTDYENDIKQKGDSVVIPGLPEIEIYDHIDGQDLEVDNPAPNDVTMLINKGKYFNFPVSLILRRQSQVDVAAKWAAHAGMKMKIAINRTELALLPAEAHASNQGASAGAQSGDINLGVSGTPLALTKSNVLDIAEDAATVLDEQSAPEEGRYIVFPAWACNRIKLSDLKDASMTGDGRSTMRNGRLGVFDRFTFYSDNNLASTTDGSYKTWSCPFGVKSACTFASQIVENETIDNQKAFGKLIRGLQVYGRKTTKPEGIGMLYIRKG